MHAIRYNSENDKCVRKVLLARFFYKLGKKAGPKVRKATWVWHSMFGSEQTIRAAESAVGQDLCTEVMQRMSRVQDDDVQARITHLGTQLTERLKDKRFEFSFIIIDQSEPNAFALPGGYVFITAPLLEACRRQDNQIAFVLAHEIAHIVKRHAMERVVMQSTVSFASNVSIFRTAVSQWARKVGLGVLQNAYSQDHELEADAFAVHLSRAAGFDPKGSITLLSTLAQTNAHTESSALYPYFSTHPPASIRIAEIQRVLK